MKSTHLEIVAEHSSDLITLDQAAETLAMRWLLAYASLRTRENYRAALNRFALFMADHKAGQVLEASRTHLDAWARSMEAEKLKPASIAANLASVSSFFAYAVSCDAIKGNPAEKVRRPKVSDISTRLGLTLETARKVVAAAEEMSPKHRAAVALMLFGGLRVSEACGVVAEDIGEELGHMVLIVRGKGGTLGKVVLPPAAMRLLGDALEVARKDSGAVLRDEQGGALDRFKVGRVINSIGRKACLGRALTPHDLRHGCATVALEVGEPMHQVQAHLRHASPVTTQRYDRNRGRLDGSAAYGIGRGLAAS
jgi:integrase/recombinase XerD